MPMDKPNFALFPAFFAAPKLVGSPPHKGQPGTLYISPDPQIFPAQRRKSHIFRAAQQWGAHSPTCPSNYDAHKYLCRRKCGFKAYCIHRILETGCSFKLIGNPQKPKLACDCWRGAWDHSLCERWCGQNGWFLWHTLDCSSVINVCRVSKCSLYNAAHDCSADQIILRRLL